MKVNKSLDDERLFKFSVISSLIFSEPKNISKQIEELANRTYYFRGNSIKISKYTIKNGIINIKTKD